MAKEKKVYGPYPDKGKGGRPKYIVEDSDGTRHSVNVARYKYEKAHHTHLGHDTDVDHKDNGGRKGHDSLSNLQAMSHSSNVAKEDKRRAHHKKKK